MSYIDHSVIYVIYIVPITKTKDLLQKFQFKGLVEMDLTGFLFNLYQLLYVVY